MTVMSDFWQEVEICPICACAMKKICNLALIYGWIAKLHESNSKSGSGNTMVTSDFFLPEVEIWPFRAYAIKYAIWPLVMAESPKLLHSSAMDLWTRLWGRYHVPQNVFLVCWYCVLIFYGQIPLDLSCLKPALRPGFRLFLSRHFVRNLSLTCLRLVENLLKTWRGETLHCQLIISYGQQWYIACLTVSSNTYVNDCWTLHCSNWLNILGRCVLLPVLNPNKSAICLHANSFSSSEPLTDGSHIIVSLCTQLLTFSALKGKKVLVSHFQSQ